MDFKKAQEILMSDPSYAKAYKEIDLPFEISKMVTNARIKRNITQQKLAELIETGQSSIARIESGNNLPSLSFLNKIAQALKMVLVPPSFVPIEEAKITVNVDARGVQQETVEDYENVKMRVDLRSSSHAYVFATI